MATETHPEWGYAGEIGPDRWGCLSSDYHLCSAGVEQSPVNLAGYVPGGTEPVTFDYTTIAVQARNNGHTVYLDFDPGSRVSVGGHRYELLGVHYHSPGEHLLDGESFAAELHLVHQDAGGNLAVVGLLFRLGKPSPLVEDLLGLAPATGVEADIGGGPNAAEFVPSHSGYYGYSGSLTTPPCSEGVRWMVMQGIGTVSPDQVDILQSLTHGPNNRPPQPIGDRQIVVSAGG
jgi:carbonic anhydrase